jgi:hypothetical protein
MTEITDIPENQRVMNMLKGWQFDRRQHGCLYDRGMADSYYSRPRTPHYGGVGGDSGPRVEKLTADERDEYLAGYDYNERSGDKKNWY